jgi:capsular exopolysaccharide synthesis family protein
LQPKALLAALRRHRWPLLLCILTAPLLASIAVSRLVPRYTATGTLIYEPAEFAARELQGILRLDPTTDAVMASQTEIVRGLPIANRLVDRFHLVESPEFNWRLRPPSIPQRLTAVAAAVWRALAGGLHVPPPAPTDGDVRHEVAMAVENAITVRNIKATRVLEVSFATEDQSLADAAVNAIMESYIGDQLDTKFGAARRASDWLRGRIADLRQEVRDAEDRIAAYRAEHGLAQGVQAGLGTEQLSRTNADLLQARSDLTAAEGRLDATRGRGGSAAQAAVAPNVAALRAQQEQLASQLQAALTRRGMQHPDVIALANQVESAQRAVAEETARMVAAGEAEVRAGRARVAALERALQNGQAQADRDAQAEIPLRAMERDADASRTLLQAVLDRVQQTGQQQAIELPDARVISPATPATEPSFPRTRLMLAAAAAFGLFFGLLLVWLLELGDSTFRSGDEVRARLGLPCFALIPELSRRTLDGARIYEYGVHKPLSPFAEQLRALRAGLWLRSRQPKVIAITAARPAEGKTTVAMALARSAAINGEKVVVLDCDVRQPSLAHRLRAGGKSGLVDCLLGHATLASVVRRDELTGVAFIPAGSAEANAAGLFTGAVMTAVLERLKAEFDLVLLDAPPALAITDARLLARLADATLLCLRWRRTPATTVRNALALLAEARADVAGIALTRDNTKVHRRAGFADSEVYHPRFGGYFRE